MSYTRIIPIEFNHCDPAGIVFYPRYFEMINSVVENFFAEALDYPFARITVQEGCSVPTVHLTTDFRAPSRLGEKVAFTLRLRGLGGRSLRFAISAEHAGQHRLSCDLTLVWVGRDGRAAPWPDALKTRMKLHLEEQSND